MALPRSTGLNFAIEEGTTLGLVGESGCGKSTVGRAILQLPSPTSGTVMFDGIDLATLDKKAMQAMRQSLQVIFQDPISSLNPRRRIRDIVAEPLVIAGIGDQAERDRRVRAVLAAVGVDPNQAMNKRPGQFSGGQCQRICIARALIIEPKLIVCDEPVASLDVSIQAQILNLLEKMKTEMKLTLLFISHDLAVVRNVSDNVIVMYLGRTCEFAESVDLFDAPLHPYTRALINAIPKIAQDQVSAAPLAGEVPSPMSPPSGCRFRTRCPAASQTCAAQVPALREVRPRHWVACHHPLVNAGPTHLQGGTA